MESSIKKVLITKEQIHEGIEKIAQSINSYYSGRRPLALIVLEGARRFAEDLLQRLNVSPDIRYIKATSYNGQKTSSGKVQIEGLTSTDIHGREVLIIDDIYDTGLTLNYIEEAISEKGAISIKKCVLLDKRAAKKKPVTIDFCGFAIDDEFVVGYGLDYKNNFRDLDYIGTLKAG